MVSARETKVLECGANFGGPLIEATLSVTLTINVQTCYMIIVMGVSIAINLHQFSAVYAKNSQL